MCGARLRRRWVIFYVRSIEKKQFKFICVDFICFCDIKTEFYKISNLQNKFD